MAELLYTEQMLSREEEEKSREANTYTLIGSDLALRVVGTRVVVVEDSFRTGFECKNCDGACTTEETCTHCNGTLAESAETVCRFCRVDGRPTGKKICPTCQGRGGLIVAPETAKQNTTSGSIVSCGPEVRAFKVGDRVIYSNYAGTAITFKQQAKIRIMEDREVIGFLFGQGRLGDSVR